MFMTTERIVLIVIWILSIGLTGLAIAMGQARQALLVIVASHAITWVNSMLSVLFGWQSFPVREFPQATELNFTTEYIFYPVLLASWYTTRPKASGRVVQVFYLILWVSLVTATDGLLAHYTRLIEYKRFTWYWKWVDILFLFLVTTVYCNWFLNKLKREESSRYEQ